MSQFADAVKVMAPELRCQHCGNTDPSMLERVGRWLHCAVCARTTILPEPRPAA